MYLFDNYFTDVWQIERMPGLRLIIPAIQCTQLALLGSSTSSLFIWTTSYILCCVMMITSPKSTMSLAREKIQE